MLLPSKFLRNQADRGPPVPSVYGKHGKHGKYGKHGKHGKHERRLQAQNSNSPRGMILHHLSSLSRCPTKERTVGKLK